MSIFTWLGSARIPGSRGRGQWLAGGLILAVGLFFESEIVKYRWDDIQPWGFAVSFLGFGLQWLGLFLFSGVARWKARLFFAALVVPFIGLALGLPGPWKPLVESLAFGLLFGHFLVPFRSALRAFHVKTTVVLLLVYLVAGASFIVRAGLDVLALVQGHLGPGGLIDLVGFTNYCAATVAVLSGNISFLILMTSKQAWELQLDAEKDALTGAFNRRALDKRLELSDSASSVDLLSVAMVDIDFFKQVNDTYGHAVGDEVLRMLAAKFRNSLRRDDFLARYGGEEFCVLMATTPNEAACGVIDRLRTAVGRQPVDSPAGPVTVTFSAGVATRPRDGTETMAELLSRADSLLYRAKSEGRNRVLGEPAADDGLLTEIDS